MATKPNPAQTRLQEEQYEVTVPVILDRCHQQRVRHALEPEREARFEPRSYGFRPGRGCHDATGAIYQACKGPMARRVWALDADLAAASDRIDHDHLLSQLGSFPARDMIRDWLKAGVLEAGKGFAPTGGWAAYYRGAVSSKVFHSLDTCLWRLTFKWARWRHRNKPRSWIVGRYFGKFNTFRNDHWVFGDRDSGAYLVKFSWTGIRRHVPVKGAASPDDPALAGYWAERRKKVKPRSTIHPAAAGQAHARCPLCGEHLLTADQPPRSPWQWERWWQQVTRKAIAASYLVHHGRPGPPRGDPTRLAHASCYRGPRARTGRQDPAQPHCTPSRLA